MAAFLARRLLYMVPTVFLISLVAFVIIQLPPGDYLTTLVAQYAAQGESLDQTQLNALNQRYGLDDPFYVQYWKWISGILFHLDFGQSFEWSRSVSSLLADRLPLTMALAGLTLLLTWVVAVPIGVYSAVKQYSIGDYVATTIGFLGLATPNFLLALVMLWVAFSTFGLSVGEANPVTFAIAILVLGTAGTAGLIRILRANLLDELRKPYVVAARAQGLPERRLLVRYPLRVAMNPFFSTIGWLLPSVVGGEVIVATVMNLNTVGPLLLGALRSQDMYLAGSIILILGVLTVVGTLVSDIALAWLDPRVRLRYR
ncbi:ABC transporter permease [Jiangella sp. DSM 45060]|uniref:ABC transporter permease n=1 Tax=Jiangella sp. DSM 45060 TaxID=1798224 RepID=UPI00087CE080|nr:ABC transporter permease [Jiangella sp. DSM 45060]SDT47131.1 peptide/nickel transport system permease protein [Jiangella sp. DSM 45060]